MLSIFMPSAAEHLMSISISAGTSEMMSYYMDTTIGNAAPYPLPRPGVMVRTEGLGYFSLGFLFGCCDFASPFTDTARCRLLNPSKVSRPNAECLPSAYLNLSSLQTSTGNRIAASDFLRLCSEEDC